MTVFLNKRGFTLLEFLAAMVIMMVGLLGLLTAVNVALNHNLQNQLRNEAIQVADSVMARELAKGFDAVSSGSPVANPKYSNESRQVLNGFKNFSVARYWTEYQNSKEIRFQVKWRYKGTVYTHDAAGVTSKANQ